MNTYAAIALILFVFGVTTLIFVAVIELRK